MTDLSSLIERVKSATGADRELDLAIATALVPDVIVLRQRDDDSGSDPYTYWEYTASLDATIALAEEVLPGWVWGVTSYTGRRSDGMMWRRSGDDPRGFDFKVRVEATTPSLALLLAILTALEEKNG